MYDIFIGEEEVGKSLAENLFMGIEGDSGGFRFINKEKSDALVKAARLIKDGDIEVQALHSRHSKKPWRLMSLVKECAAEATLEDKLSYPPFILAYIPKIEGFSNVEFKNASSIFLDSFYRITAEAKWIAILYPRDDQVKISLRSGSEDINVREIAEKMGVGGGHDSASGGILDKKIKDPAEGIKWVMKWLKENKF